MAIRYKKWPNKLANFIGARFKYETGEISTGFGLGQEFPISIKAKKDIGCVFLTILGPNGDFVNCTDNCGGSPYEGQNTNDIISILDSDNKFKFTILADVIADDVIIKWFAAYK